MIQGTILVQTCDDWITFEDSSFDQFLAFMAELERSDHKRFVRLNNDIFSISTIERVRFQKYEEEDYAPRKRQIKESNWS